MLSLAQVQTFLAILDEGSIQQAAQRLSCSQPTVSQQLRKLEEYLGAALIFRNRGQSVPTQAGQLFIPHARSLMAAAERSRAVIENRRLNLVASGNIGVYLAPRLVADFETRRRGEYSVDLAITTNRGAIDALLSGTADVVMSEWRETHPSIEWLSWCREKLVVIAPKDHLLARQSLISKDELLSYPIIGGESGTGTGRILRDFFGQDSCKLQIGRQLGSTAAVKEAVKAGLGLSIVLAYTVESEVASGSLVALDIKEADIFKTLYLGISADCPQSSLTRAFVHHCTTHTQQDAHIPSAGSSH
ncbi:LysR family transcriptional regulator [Roseibium aestuarii]|uniref:LysR family transcriptional regulator n=1 Tax=Roseibium aestuarii TaxID=2600299 RepID=A0ABW4JY77_9HYPH|nr:LysR family transcriptional regulator [Roseibium aestuarii]